MHEETEQLSLRRAVVSAVTLLLWLATTFLALWCVYVLRQTYYLLYARLARLWGGGDYELADVVGYCLLPLFVMAFIAFVTFTGEYHRQHLGKPRSWQIFGITIAVEVAILAFYQLIQ